MATVLPGIWERDLGPVGRGWITTGSGYCWPLMARRWFMWPCRLASLTRWATGVWRLALTRWLKACSGDGAADQHRASIFGGLWERLAAGRPGNWLTGTYKIQRDSPEVEGCTGNCGVVVCRVGNRGWAGWTGGGCGPGAFGDSGADRWQSRAKLIDSRGGGVCGVYSRVLDNGVCWDNWAF